MPEGWQRHLRTLAKRAGLERVPDSVILAAVVACVVLIAFGAYRWWPKGQSEEPLRIAGAVSRAAGAPASATRAQTAAESGSRDASAAASVWVHVVGAVRRPGVYELPTDARVVAALEAAGGLLGNAAAEAVNLARAVQDGEQILVPTKDEFAKAGGAGAAAGAASAGGAVGSGAGGASRGPAGGPIDLNSADAALLDTLPGVGPSTAAKIVADREANGPFASVDDLGRVSGIGPKKLDALKDLVCVR